MATINDVAKMAGVSAATVSHVVNKTRYVSPTLVKRVEDTIQSLEFPPNFVVKKSKILAVPTDKKYIVCLCSDMKQPFQMQICQQMKKIVHEAGFTLIATDYGGSSLSPYLQILLSTPSAKGLILFPGENEEALRKDLDLVQVPIVLIGRDINGFSADSIISENFKGSYKATNHLIQGGHENIALICAEEASKYSSKIIDGYKSALEKNKIAFKPNYLISSLPTKDETLNALKPLLLGKNAPTAILSADYKTTVYLFEFIEASNIDCPKDLSVIGFGDFDWAPLFTPPITVVSQDIKQIASLACQNLLEKIKVAESDDKNTSQPSIKTSSSKISVPVNLKIRSSTRGIGRGPFGEIAASPEVLHLSSSDIKLVQSGHYTAAISFHYTGKAWMQLHEQGIKDVFNNLGISLLAITDAHFDPVMQSKQLESILTLEPDVIISIPTDNIKVAPAFKKIAKSNTKLVLITNVPKGLTTNDYVTCVSVNERSNGCCAARGLGEYMKKHNKTNVGLIRYGATFYATNQRDNAVEQILREEYPDLKIVGSVEFQTEDAAYEKTLELLTAHPEINGIYISWEGPAMKAISAIKEINRTDIAIATTDLEYAMALNMAKGGMVKALSAQCPYEQGQTMALAAANSLIGKQVPSFIGIEPIYVTPDNLLRSWQNVYKEKPSAQLINALKDNPNYISYD